MTLVSQGHSFTEGPIWLPTKGEWLYSDVAVEGGIEWTWKAGAKAQVYRNPSEKANGHCFDADAKLITTQMRMRRLISDDLSKTEESKVVVSEYEDLNLTSPNDVILHKPSGRLIFTDPAYGTNPKFGHGDPSDQTANRVYSYDQKTNVITALYSGMIAPNGLALNSDGTKLYVADTGNSSEGSFKMMEFSINAEGSELADAVDWYTDEKIDGMKIDASGNFWLAVDTGVIIMDKAKKVLAKIKTNEVVANLAFGGADGKQLMITSSTTVWVLPVKVMGNDAPAQTSAPALHVMV